MFPRRIEPRILRPLKIERGNDVLKRRVRWLESRRPDGGFKPAIRIR
jgi:hypothetical protein